MKSACIQEISDNVIFGLVTSSRHSLLTPLFLKTSSAVGLPHLYGEAVQLTNSLYVQG